MRPSEKLTAGFLSAFTLLALAARAPWSGLAFAAVATATVVLARTVHGSGAAGFARDFFPVVAVIVAFLLLEPVISGLVAARWDAQFAAFDERHLAWLVSAWRGALGRPAWLTDAAYAAYASYFLLPVAVGASARSLGPAPFERAAFAILLAFYASFAGYFLLPASGPRVPFADEATLLGGGAVSQAVRAFLRSAELTRLDAFPSGHTAVSIVCAAAGARLFPRAAPAIVAWAAAIVFSTVYVHVHYAVDVLAGAALAAGAVAAAGPLSRVLGAPDRVGTPAVPPPRR